MSRTKNDEVVIPLGAWIHGVPEQAKTEPEEHMLSVGRVSRTLAMCSSEEADLLRLEEVFSTTLDRIITLNLKPLLLADPEPSDLCGKECLGLLQQLHESAQRLWDVTEQSLLSLRQRLYHPSSLDLEAILLLSNADLVLQAHVEYIKSYTDCVVVQAFQKVSRKKSEFWRSQRKEVWQLLSSGSAQRQVLYQPLADHVQKYVRLLLRLRDSLGETHPAQELVMHAVTLFENLQPCLRQALDQAEATQALWNSLSSRLRGVLCVPTHRLLQDSQDIPVVVSPLRVERVLLFDDVLVLLQGHNVHTFDLKLVWVDPGQDKCVLHILTPEDEFSFCTRDPKGQVAWQWKMTQAVRQALCGKKDFPVLESDQALSVPPESRRVACAYTFRREGRLYQATYEGDWCRAKPHGKGTLKWPDGRNHVGDFWQGLEHGFGIRLVPQASEDKFDCYKCHWREGKMCEYGICEYGTGKVYKGYFQAGLRHGFGILDSAPQAPQPIKYTGHWERGQRSGYGIEEAKDRGERYIGMWQADQRHGPGVMITQGGVYQGTFQGDKMAGPGILLHEDDSLYEGIFTRDLTLLEKGKVTLPNGFTLNGSFSRGTNEGQMCIQGVLHRAAHPSDSRGPHKRQLGAGAFPVESRWQGVYGPFRDFVRLGCPGEMQEALLGFHVQSSRELRESQEHLCEERSHPEDGVGSMEDILKELLQHRKPKALQQYLGKALGNSRHPLGKLLRTLMLTFQATYSHIGSIKHLQEMATEEVKQHARELWAAYRGLLKVALERQGQTLEEESTETRDLQVHGVLLPLILPSFYSELFSLYLLLHEGEDQLYSRGITNLSLFSDTNLLEYLWSLKDLKLTSNQRYSLVRDNCFLSATECLQKISTTMNTQEKLEVLEKTYREIEATVSQVLGREYKLPMDDLLPLFIYVVSRAQIQHLGAEIHFIRDMMDPIHTGGLHDFLLTALESCYKHIQNEDMRPHRLPGHWDD